MKSHVFSISAPFDGRGAEIMMDGLPLESATSAVVKLGSNGFTNVAVEFYAESVIDCEAALFASIATKDSDWAERTLTPVMHRAFAESLRFSDIPLADFLNDADSVGEVAKRFLELLIESTTGTEI